MTDETLDPFKEKVRRMFFPAKPSSQKEVKRHDPDLDVMDPFERFEKAIRKDAEKKKEGR